MTCEDVQNLLAEYAKNRLDSKVRDEVERHLNHCQDCQKEFSAEQLLTGWLESRKTEEVSPQFTANLQSRVGIVTAKPPRWFDSLLELSNYWAPALAAFLVVIFGGKTLLDWIRGAKSIGQQTVNILENIPPNLESSSFLGQIIPSHLLSTMSLGTFFILLVIVGGLAFGIHRIFRS
jgi:hypothetical protein